MKTKLCIVLLLLMLTACGKQVSQEEPIKVGAVLMLTGDVASIGNAMRQGIEIAQEEINAQGGFHGKPIQMVFEDDHFTGANPSLGAVTAAQKLVSQDRVVASISTSVNDAKPAAPTFEVAKIPLVTLWDANRELEDLGDYTFSIGFSTEHAGEVMAEYAYHKLGLKEVSATYHIDEWSSLIYKSFVARFKELGGSVTEIGSYSAVDTDYRTLIAKVKSANSPAIYFPFIPVPSSASFIKQVKELGYSGVILTGDSVNPDLLSAVGNAAEGMYYTQMYAQDSEKLEHLRTSYQKKYGSDPQLLVFTSLGYDGLYTIFEAMKLADSTDPVAIKDAIYKIKGFQGATGTITFNDKGSAPKEERIWQVKGGKEVLIT